MEYFGEIRIMYSLQITLRFKIKSVVMSKMLSNYVQMTSIFYDNLIDIHSSIRYSNSFECYLFKTIVLGLYSAQNIICSTTNLY